MATQKQAPTITAMNALGSFLAHHRKQFEGNELAIKQIDDTLALAETKDDAYWEPIVEANTRKSQHALATACAQAIAAELQAK